MHIWHETVAKMQTCQCDPPGQVSDPHFDPFGNRHLPLDLDPVLTLTHWGLTHLNQVADPELLTRIWVK